MPKYDAGKLVAGLDWPEIAHDLNEVGIATTGRLLDAEQCAALRALYPDDRHFRSHIVMKRHGFGEGEYKYYANPLPEIIVSFREAFYPRIAPIANEWHRRMGIDRRFPESLRAFLDECHADGQARSTPLLLKYGPGDYNCLHQDLYGVRHDRATSAHAVTRRGRAAVTRTWRAVHRQRSAESRFARRLSRQDAARRQPGPKRRALYDRHHFSRCRLTFPRPFRGRGGRSSRYAFAAAFCEASTADNAVMLTTPREVTEGVKI